jgi:3-methyladenine DNA glycosylase AlkC
MCALTSHPQTNVRRAIVLAAMDAAARHKPERAAPLLALVEPLLPDRAEYVRKNLGPFAIGAALLPAYPEQTFPMLRAWAGRENEVTRWNVAMACSSAAAARYPAAASAILRALATDERRFVRGAVRSAARKLAARQPGLDLPL